jgi:hypothetical protein
MEIMWLPKDERKLLQGYYVTIGEFGEQHEFPLEHLMGFIKSSASDHLPPADDAQRAKKYNAWLKDRNRIITANKALEERGLIKLSHDNNVFICTYREAGPHPRLTVSLTINGYDIGRKYNSWFARTGLLYAEYRHHWIWLIGSFIGGIIATLLAQWLSKVII